MASASTRSYVELKVSATGLRGRRLDPFAVLQRLSAAATGIPQWTEVARTEVVWADPSPSFVQSFEVPYNPDDPSVLQLDHRITVFSKSSRSDELRKNTFLGYAEFAIERALSKVDGVIERVLRSKAGKNDGKRGCITICAEDMQVPDLKHMFSIQFGFGFNSHAWGPYPGRKAKKAFYVIFRAILNGLPDDDWLPVYRSEIVDPYAQRNQDVMFEGASIRAEQLYGSDENRGLRFEVFHYNPSGPHIPLGFVQTSASVFKYAKPGGKLYMVPAPCSTMKQAFVTLDMAKIGLTTRRGGVSSVFCLRASGFTWGDSGDSGQGDDYLERDAFGRTGIDVYVGPTQTLPRGVSYMGTRKNRIGDAGGSKDIEEE